MHPRRFSPLLLLLLLGCASRQHVRYGDDAAVSQDWIRAYDAYEQAVRSRPGSARAQQRLSQARTEVLALLDDHLASALQARRFEEVGQILTEVSRFQPPRPWLEAHTEAALLAIRADAKTRTHPEAHALLTACAAFPPLSSLSADQARVGTRWAADLRQQADDAVGRGELGAGIVLRDGALRLQDDPEAAAKQHRQWKALLAGEWGGVYLTVRGPIDHQAAVQSAIQQRWVGSGWSEVPLRSRAPGITHVVAAVNITEASCTETRTDATAIIRPYTDGTFVPNPRIQTINREILNTTRSLRSAVTADEDALARLTRAQQLEAGAEAAVATEAPRQEAARRRDADAEHHLQEASAQYQTSLDAQASIRDREAEVNRLLAEQRDRNAAHHDLEQDVLPDRLTDQEAAQRAHRRAEQAHADAHTAAGEASRAVQEAEQRIGTTEQARDTIQARLSTVRIASESLPEHQKELHAAVEAREAAAEAHRAAAEAARQATAHLTALQSAEGILEADLLAAEHQQKAALQTRRQTREALAEARRTETRSRDLLAELEETIALGEALEDTLAETEQALQDARSALETARPAVGHADVDLAQARRRLDETDARLRQATGAVDSVQAQLDALYHQDTDQARRLSQIESEIGALSPSVALLPARQEALRTARQARDSAARRLQEAEDRMVPLLAELDRARHQTTHRQEILHQRQRDRRALSQALHRLQDALNATPVEVELVKEHPYTVETWTRTCTFTVTQTLRGAAAGRQPLRTATTTSRDQTWPGFAPGSLAADPLQYTTTDTADLTRSRTSVVEAVWSDLSAQLIAEGKAHYQRASQSSDLEETTRAWLLATWLDPARPDDGLASSLQAQYRVPAGSGGL